jgi:predicted transport protein
MIIFQNNKKFQEYKYNKEDELEKEIVDNYQLFFGKETIYINTKKKIDTKALGGAIPDGLLFDFSDKEEPEFYIVEVELESHNFFNHIFPQITKFFSFFKNRKSQVELVEKTFSVINTNPELKREFKKYLGEKEIYKTIKDTIENSQNILLLIDGKKDELPEIMETYSATWGKMVKLIILKKFIKGNEFIYTIEPEFKDIEYVNPKPTIGQAEYTEEFHLEDINNEVKNVYFRIKEELLKISENFVFNPQKYYISVVYNRNVAFFRFRKKKIRLVILLPEGDVRKRIKSHSVKHLSGSVQKFYNGSCCDIIIDGKENLDEIISLFKFFIREHKKDSTLE